MFCFEVNVLLSAVSFKPLRIAAIDLNFSPSHAKKVFLTAVKRVKRKRFFAIALSQL